MKNCCFDANTYEKRSIERVLRPRLIQQMTDRQDKFVQFYAETGNATQAAIHAGYSEKTAKQQGHQLKEQLRPLIAEKTKEVLADKVPNMLNLLTTIAETSTSDTARISAIKDLLDRAGLKPIERIEQTNIESMSDEEIQRQIDSLIKH